MGLKPLLPFSFVGFSVVALNISSLQGKARAPICSAHISSAFSITRVSAWQASCDLWQIHRPPLRLQRVPFGIPYFRLESSKEVPYFARSSKVRSISRSLRRSGSCKCGGAITSPWLGHSTLNIQDRGSLYLEPPPYYGCCRWH